MAGSQHSAAPDFTAVPALLEFIESQIGALGRFEISLEALCRRLGISLVDAYRTLYESQGEIGGYIPERFTTENVNILARFISLISGEDAETMFHNAGTYLSSSDLSELAALYYDTAGQAIEGHIPQFGEFGQMYRRFKTHRRAFDVYVDYFFDLDRIFEETVTAFVSYRSFSSPLLGRHSTQSSLSLLIKRNVVSIMGMFEQLFESLTGEHPESESPNHIRHPALTILGLDRLPRNKRDLRDHYKTLMKTYHPDINPAGLEMCKKINAAYADLLASWSKTA